MWFSLMLGWNIWYLWLWLQILNCFIFLKSFPPNEQSAKCLETKVACQLKLEDFKALIHLQL